MYRDLSIFLSSSVFSLAGGVSNGAELHGLVESGSI